MLQKCYKCFKNVKHAAAYGVQMKRTYISAYMTYKKKRKNIYRFAAKLKCVWLPAGAMTAMLLGGAEPVSATESETTAVDAESEAVQVVQLNVKDSTPVIMTETEDGIGLMGGAALDTEYIALDDIRDQEGEFALPLAGAADGIEIKEKEAMEAAAEAAENLQEEHNEYENLAIANVSYDFVNVRSGPSTDSVIVGKMYDGSVAEILDRYEQEDGLWFQVSSGSVEGFIKAEYFYYDEDLIGVIDQYVTHSAVIQANVLNVRNEAGMDGAVIGYLTAGEKAKVIEEDGEWIKVEYSNKTGYIAAQYAMIEEDYITAKSLEEERKELEEKKKKEQREQAARLAAVQEDVTLAVNAAAANYSSNPELRQAIINYAMQFVGNRYVMGGQSLAGGTDCSGFTCYVYRAFGYSLSRTPSGQLATAGRPISLAEVQPGDIICYGYGGCSHVAMYIGNGQIVHEANSRMGCIVSSINFEPIVGVKNVID